MNKNFDSDVIDDFGNEWGTYDQSSVNFEELKKQFLEYFNVFPWTEKIEQGMGADFGCGSGRWARFVADKVDTLLCIDASSKALNATQINTKDKNNCHIIQSKIDALPLPDNALDFAYSLGVLHHLPDTASAIKDCVSKLKAGAPLLIYLYYKFDNRPGWYFWIWKCSDILRRIISKLPFYLKYMISNIIALFVYFPLARLAYLAEKLHINVKNIPLTEYRAKSFYTMRTDALDRFGTRLENRFTKKEIQEMMEEAGLENIKFSNLPPYWCAVGIKA